MNGSDLQVFLGEEMLRLIFILKCFVLLIENSVIKYTKHQKKLNTFLLLCVFKKSLHLVEEEPLSMPCREMLKTKREKKTVTLLIFNLQFLLQSPAVRCV